MADYLKKLRDQGQGIVTKPEEKPRGTGYTYAYAPNKKNRAIRVNIMDRYRRMRDDPLRKEAELDWEQGDKFSRLWRPERDPDDWRADIRLPDAFAAIQTHMQETIGMKLRPSLKAHEGSDSALEFYGNSIMKYNMDRTGHDLQTVKAMYSAAARGTAFTMEVYLYETRMVKDPTSVENGIIQYTKREIVDKDDTFMQFVPNERIFVDEAADNIEIAEDMIFEERLRYDSFKTKYCSRDDCYDTEKVVPVGSLSERTHFFDRQDDIDGDMVQILHYYNKMTDSYQCLANTVVIRDSPIPFKHKELPLAIWNYYPVEGRIWGMGIPKIIAPTQEEREAIRNLSLDRQKMHLNKMFLVSDLFDLDEDEATTRPHGFIHVNAGGMSLDNVIKPIEYGDVPGSSIRMDDQLREDERRVHGIDDRSQGVNMGGTATEAAILTEASQKRINLINTLTGMATIERIGRLKWSNIRFFYDGPRIERLNKPDGSTVEKKVYRKIAVDGKEFKIEKNEGSGKDELVMNDIDGTSSFKLDSTYARYMEGDEDVRIQWDIESLMPKSIRQQRLMDLASGLGGNPMFAEELDARGILKDIIREFDFDPRKWMTNKGRTVDQEMEQAEFENEMMAKGHILEPTPEASEMHTLVHIMYAKSVDYQKLPDTTKKIFERHILGENEDHAGQGAGAAAGAPPTPPGMPPLPPNATPAPSASGQPVDPNGVPVPPPGVAPINAIAQGGEVTQQMGMGA